jgi:hypothetical protein
MSLRDVDLYVITRHNCGGVGEILFSVSLSRPDTISPIIASTIKAATLWYTGAYAQELITLSMLIFQPFRLSSVIYNIFFTRSFCLIKN